MENTSREFGLFIDNIRSTRNMSREDFVEGILSTRQFQRYIKGDSSISIETILMLIDRLELDFFTTYNRFLNSSNREHTITKELFNYIISVEYKKAYDLIQEYKDYKFASLYYKKLFDTYVVMIDHKLLRISTNMAMKYMEKSINYPGCMEQNELNYIELITLLYMAQIVSSEVNINDITLKVFEILKYHKISDFGKNDARMASLYSAFSKLLGSQDKFAEVILLTKKGIELCKLHKTTNSLAHLYYYCALGYLGQENTEEALKCVKKAFFTLEIENQPLKYDAFIKIFESHFNMKFANFKTW